MTRRLPPVLMIAGVCLIVALSTGSSIYLMIAVLLGLSVLSAFLSVMGVARTVQITQELTQQKVNRGDDVALEVTISHRGLIPIAPVTLTLCELLGGKQAPVRLQSAGGRKQQLRFPFHARHVGVLNIGVESYRIEDVFGFFCLNRQPTMPSPELLVLPLPFDIEDLKFAPGDSGLESMARATEDITSPA